MCKKAIYLIMLCGVLLSACSQSGKTYRIAVSQCGGGQWRDKVNQEMLAAQHLYEQNVKVTVTDAHDDTQQQIRDIDSMAGSGIDLLVVAPNESAPIAEVIAKVRQKGIPVIFFDRKAETDDYTAFIGGNNVEAGHTVGDYAAALAKDIKVGGKQPTVVEITGALSTSPARERHQGFSEAMAGCDWLRYISIANDWSADSAYDKLKQQLSKGVTPDIVFCHNDAMCMGAARAFEEAGLLGTVNLLGIDGMPAEGITYVQQGKLAGTYIYPTHGERIVKLALDILTGQKYTKENPLQGMMVTPDNVDIIALNSRELMKQNHDLITIQDKLEDYFGLYNTQHRVLIASLVSIVLLIVGLLMTWRAAKQISRAHRRQKQLNEEQTRFYTNASHQLKTPLTLIAGPVKELLNGDRLKGDERGLLEIVGRNIEQLESVTSSVLNFRKEMNAMVSDETAAQQEPVSETTIQEARLAVMKHEDTDDLPSILIVEDNADIRYYLRTLLSDRFYVLEAADGQLGLKIAREIVPDIVVSDVMMPVMDGLEFCQRLKEDTVTSHIPVILLTARDTEAQQVEGYEHGADAYLTKPFNADLLIARIYNLVKSRQQLRQLFDSGENRLQAHDDIAPEPSKIRTQDKLFADAVKEAILKNMANPNLKMDELGEELGLSRVQLYRKVKALTGLSPVELLRQMRLQRGRTLLQTTTKTVNEIAYEVGFGTPGYFSKCFKQQYGKYPMEMRAE